jgi:hypothetical protein
MNRVSKFAAVAIVAIVAIIGVVASGKSSSQADASASVKIEDPAIRIANLELKLAEMHSSAVTAFQGQQSKIDSLESRLKKLEHPNEAEPASIDVSRSF